MQAASAERRPVTGTVPPRSEQWWRTATQSQPAPRARATVAQVQDPAETRALVALGYPLWPLALIALFDRKQSRRLRKHAYQALGFNFGMAGLFFVLDFLGRIPVLGWSAEVLLAFILPVFVVMSVYYGIKAWHGDDVHVPIISDWLDDRMPA